MTEITSNDIHKIIDDAMKNKDRCVHIFMTNTSTSINISPVNEDDGMKWKEDENGFNCSRCGGCSPFPFLYCPECGEQRTGTVDLEG